MKEMERSRFSKGRDAEEAAAAFLVRNGLEVLDRNFRCPVGEIDIIVREARTIVFVEVRGRRDGRFGGPEESITPLKGRRVLRAAQWYLKKNGLDGRPARIDVIAIRWNGEEPEINWIVNALTARS